MSEEIVVGIDLGTTNTCVGYFWNGKIEIMENEDGDRITPSVVFFLQNERTIVGKYAKKLSASKSGRTVSEVKRLIGRQYNDYHIQSNLQHFDYQLERFNGDLFKIVINGNKGEGVIKKTPQEICCLILKQIKNDIDTKFGKNITKVVITVPAYFSVSQREATLKAAQSAEFDVLKLLNEPTSAALSYFYNNKKNHDCYALVYDLGGGTFDVAILKRTNDQIDIICVDGDSYLGGHDFDELLVNYVCRILKNQYNYNPRNKYEDMRRILIECEEAKKALSSKLDETEIFLNGFINKPITINLTRNEFENEANELFKRTITIMDRCLITSKLEKNQINEIILSGGSTRIPKIRQLISEYFDRKDLNRFLNPDECVAEGAALQAAMLSTHEQQQIDSFTINDVTALSLGIGIGVIVDVMDVIIPRNSPIPICRSVNRGTIHDKQTAVIINIYEGERINVKKNYLLASFEMHNLTPAPPGQCRVTLTLSIDCNGILTATAKEDVSGKIKDLKIVYTRGNRSGNEIETILVDAEINKEEDVVFMKMAKIKNYLIEYCIRIKYNLTQKNLTKKYKMIYDRCDEVQKIAKQLNVGDEERIQQLMQKTENLCKDVVRKYRFALMPRHHKF